MERCVSLAEMGHGQTGKVLEIQGGHGLTRRLDAMGIRPGVRLTKTAGPHLGGPVTVRCGNSQTALGFGMARKVIVEVKVEETG